MGAEEEKGREVKRGKLSRGAGRRMRVGVLELAGVGDRREAGGGRLGGVAGWKRRLKDCALG